MKKPILILLVVILPLTIAGFLLWPQLTGTDRNNDYDVIIGTWEGTESSGSLFHNDRKTGKAKFHYDLTLIFKRDSSFTRLEDGEVDEWSEDGRRMKWKLNAEAAPAQLDLLVYDSSGQELCILRGIYRFMNDDKTKLAIQFNQSLHDYSIDEDLLTRPVKFDDNQQIIFTRK